MKLCYKTTVNLCWIYANLVCDVQVYGLENIPKKPGYLLTANHLSYFDPFIIAKHIPDIIHYLAMQELFTSPVSRYIMQKWHTIPIKRGSADKTALKQALTLLKQDHIVGVFPEGGIKKKHAENTYQAGVAMLALHSGKPVLPVRIEGSRWLYRPNPLTRHKIIVTYKPSFHLHKKELHSHDIKDTRTKAIELIEQKITEQ